MASRDDSQVATVSDYLTEYQAWLDRFGPVVGPLLLTAMERPTDGALIRGEYQFPIADPVDYAAIRDAVYEGDDDA